ncbi:hypothetical protein PVAND_009408 [Polypedilum vanderplanki]|uniref:Uncharacterized protein n=1 Tax=Polypedilum vanderplanki TaxID=319348 RepID=A0A9J6CD22_POLVA|nr:hypothetical protein PVAND_009408 [Polypedilum vanderplanki]
MLNEIETNAIMSNARKTIEACHSTILESQEIRRQSSEAVRRASEIQNFYKFNFPVESIPTNVIDDEVAVVVKYEEQLKVENNAMHDKRNPKVNNDDLCCHDKVKRDARFEREDANIKPRQLINDPTAIRRRQAFGKSKMSRHQKNH